MPYAAILLMNLQQDFLDREARRTPVDERGTKAALRVASSALSASAFANRELQRYQFLLPLIHPVTKSCGLSETEFMLPNTDLEKRLSGTR